MIGSPHRHERVLRSTNERARELALAGAPHGTLVTADEQTAGRGRQGRRWLARRKEALLMSLVVRQRGHGAELLPLRAALAVCEACESLADVRCEIKWPNDVWIDHRKVAGILIEGRPHEGWAVVGIGLNVRARDFAEEIAATATSLALATGTDLELELALDALLAALDEWLDAPPGTVIDAWRERDALAGRPVRWGGGSGTAAGISDDGALLVELGDGSHVELDAGEVHLG